RTYNNANQLVSIVPVGLNVTDGRVTGVVITNGGSGYISATVTISAPNLPGGIQATGNAIVNNGAVTGVTITNEGSGYTTAPTITFSASNGPNGGIRASGTGVLGGTPLRAQGPIPFVTRYVLNAIDPKRMLLGTNILYESFDRGDTLLRPNGTTNMGRISALAYGGPPNCANNPHAATARPG